MELSVLYRDERLVAIDKPSGLLVHPTELAPGEPSALKILRDQLGALLYPVHRLDRQTSGVLLFALSSDAAREVMVAWRGDAGEPGGAGGAGVRKKYRAIVRGWLPESGRIERALREEPSKPRLEAVTLYRRIDTVEIPAPVGRYSTARYCALEVETLTGRQHQIRKHLVGVSHPIVGDTTYGDGDHNRFFRGRFGLHRLLLHASELELPAPGGARLKIAAPLPEEFLRPGFSW